MNQTIKTRIEQIGRGEVPEGYKKTKVGIVPKDWEVSALGKYIVEYRELSNEIDFSFLDEYKEQGYKLLIHCNQGESRAPTLGMLYAARFGAFGYADFATSVRELQKIYPQYNPKMNIYKTVEALWQYFVR